MLVLSRKQTESIVIGPDITIKVIKISGGRVRIAIDAPGHIKISRGELVETTLAPACGQSQMDDSCAIEFQQAP